MTHSLYAIATMDTKGEEISYLAQRARVAGAKVLTVDVGTQASPSVLPDITRERVAACHPQGAAAVDGKGDRGKAVAAMSQALTTFLAREHATGRVAGVIGIGGSGGTALLAPAFRSLPVGLPKLIVSTVANGNTTPYIDTSDLLLAPSIVDVAGLNRVSRVILANAAHAIAGMVLHQVPATNDRPCLGLTMFGVTTPCVTAARTALEAQGFDPLVFHATGTGGRAMEGLIAAGLISGVLDLTTTEVADAVAGGIWSCADNRFAAALEARIPSVLSLGACDMVNFGARETVPEAYRQRRLHVHNAQVTLMRTSIEDNRKIGAFIAERLNRATAPWTLLIPLGGVSMLDAPGQPFHDPQADAALFDELDTRLVPAPGRTVLKLREHINDPAFAAAAVAEFLTLNRSSRTPTT